MRFKGLTPFNEICFSCFTYTVTIRFNEFKRNKLHVSSAVIVTQKMFGYCGGLRAVSLFVNRSAMFVEAVFKSTFGFSYVVTVVTLYHVDNVLVQNADCRLQTGYKMQTRYKMQTADCRLSTKCRLTRKTFFTSEKCQHSIL